MRAVSASKHAQGGPGPDCQSGPGGAGDGVSGDLDREVMPSAAKGPAHPAESFALLRVRLVLGGGREAVGKPRDEVFRYRPLPSSALRCWHSGAHVVGPAFSFCGQSVDCLFHCGEQVVGAEVLQKPAALELPSDGLVESRDARGEFLSEDQIATAFAAPDCDQALDTMMTAAHRHTGGHAHDDIALLLLEHSAPTPSSANGHPTARATNPPGTNVAARPGPRAAWLCAGAAMSRRRWLRARCSRDLTVPGVMPVMAAISR